MSEDKIVIDEANKINYCPKCGSETRKEEYNVKNSVVSKEETHFKAYCPEHGRIVLEQV